MKDGKIKHLLFPDTYEGNEAMNVADQMAEYLNSKGAATPKTIADAIPELSQCGGAERALLLLRLNPKFEQMNTDVNIMEGGREAFNRRKEIYQIWKP